MMEVMLKDTGMCGNRLENLTEHINRNYIDPGKIAGCQILVSRHGSPAYSRSFGMMDIESKKAMAEDAIFRIYSMSKPMTSVALMQLFEKGYFQLNDPVSRFIPAWKDQEVYISGEGDNLQTRKPDNPMTFRHLLSHSGGLSYGNTTHPVDEVYKTQKVNRRTGETLETFVNKLAKVPLMYDPGTAWMYSLSTDVCGYLVEVISGKPFDVYLKENIFEPLGMADTAFFVDGSKADRLTSNYQRNADKTLGVFDAAARSTYLKEPTFFSGGGGLTSTTADYYKFTEMLRMGGQLGESRVLGPRTLQLMTQNHLPDGKDLTQLAIGNFSETTNEGVGFGLGFAMTLGEVKTGSPGVGDFYWGGAASTIFWVDPVDDLVVIFMTQLMPSGTFNFRGQLKNIIYASITD